MTHLKGLATVCVVLALVSQARSAEIQTPKDGWASWQVEVVEDAPAYCCWSSSGEKAGDPQACDLDNEHGTWGARDHGRADAARVYARFKDGKLERLRTLAVACPISTATPVQKLEGISTDDSARWLTGLTPRGDLEQEVMSSLAMHRGERAFDALNKLARDDSRTETRKHAIFWLAMLRGKQGAEVARAEMFGDQDPEIRKHAAFAFTQSKDPGVAAELIKLGNTDPDGDVRAQAWFWLAQSGSPEAERAISAALRKDTDGHVREQGVFALSQLPDGRGTKALIAVAEDRALAYEQRKRAVFWLGQSESADAQAYLDKVLMKAASK